MSCSPFDIARRINAGTPLKATPTTSPQLRLRARSPQRQSTHEASLSLQRIIGTTTNYPPGLTSHYDSSSFAYCAGSAAVLGKVGEQGALSFRYFRAHPTVSPVHPCVSFYNPATTPTGTPEGRRRANPFAKPGVDEKATVNSPRRIWGEEATSRAWSARERVKAASCVHLSENGRFLVVGETGYNPRVNIFSLVDGTSSDIPLTTLTEHTFGVRAVAFSPSSRWLATLGDINDGFLFIWSVNAKTGAAKLQFANKCTASVLDMAWCGNGLVTAGVRHVKVWRVEDPSIVPHGRQGRLYAEKDGAASPAPKTLSGRNCRLGDMMDSTFTCVKSISDSEAILCTTSGAVCLLNDYVGKQELRYVKQMSTSTQSAAVDLQRQEAHFTTNAEHLESEAFESLRRQAGICPPSSFDQSKAETTKPSCPASPSAVETLNEPPSSRRSWGPESGRSEGATKASACLPNGVVTIDQDRNILVRSLTVEDITENSESGTTITLPSHNDTVQGVISLPTKSGQGDYLTWSLGGHVNIWALDGSLRRSLHVELDQLEQKDWVESINELRLVRISRDGQWLIAGDRLGVLQIIDSHLGSISRARAHGSEITDIALSTRETSLLVATGGRDRTVQLLQHSGVGVKLLQTFDEHAAAVNAVAFSSDYLISASSDRTVVVRQQVSRANADGTASVLYGLKRVITLKASPTSFAFLKPEEMVVSTMDKQVLTFNIVSGVPLDGFKALDAEGEDAVVLTSLNVDFIKTNSGSRRIVTGFSAVDKSIRVYDFDLGILLARELSHTEGISAIAMLEHSDDSIMQGSRTLISTGLDGLIIVWGISATQLCAPLTPLHGRPLGQEMTCQDGVDSAIKDSILRQPPQRKVISKMEFADINGVESPVSPVQGRSPPRLKKRRSRQSLVPRRAHGLPRFHSAEDISPTEGDATARSPRDRLTCLSPNGVNNRTRSTQCSPSIACMARKVSTATQDQRSARQFGEASRSPSPPRLPLCLPVSQSQPNRANKGRLRKPPSVPSDLGAKSDVSARRRSLGNITGSSSGGAVGERLCHTLRAYRKTIENSPREGSVHFNEVEIELLATLRVLEKRHDAEIRGEYTSMIAGSFTQTRDLDGH